MRRQQKQLPDLRLIVQTVPPGDLDIEGSNLAARSRRQACPYKIALAALCSTVTKLPLALFFCLQRVLPQTGEVGAVVVTSRSQRPKRLVRANGFEKAYGTLNHLNAHVTMQSHGAKRSPDGLYSLFILLSLCLIEATLYFPCSLPAIYPLASLSLCNRSLGRSSKPASWWSVQ